MSHDKIRLHDSWKSRLASEFEQPYMQKLRAFLLARTQAGAQIYPPAAQIFAALDATTFEQVKVVILGQDPYHGAGQAHGLCFSVQAGTAPPPSLVNIFKELEGDLGLVPPAHGCLSSWAAQGVLLLNAVLTVEQGQAGAHQRQGWELFTDTIVNLLNRERENLVFLLWGSQAQAKAANVDKNRHLLLKAPHPSPLSAYRGFIGCNHFSQANRWLLQHDLTPIDWKLPPLA